MFRGMRVAHKNGVGPGEATGLGTVGSFGTVGSAPEIDSAEKLLPTLPPRRAAGVLRLRSAA